jgi:hypothetical protein
MSKRHHKKGHLPPFVPLIRTTLASPAWKQLSFGARSLYIVLRSYLRVDNRNNGKVFRSYRDAADDLGTKSTRSVQRWFRELEHYGFIVMTTGGCLGVDGEGVAPHWRITECPTFDAKGTHIAPTRDFDRWDGVLFVDPVKTESRIPKGHTPYPKGTHTDDPKRGQKRSKCIPKGHIDSAPSMYPKGAHNCLPLPKSPMCWSTPRLVEMLDPAERAAIQAYWRPKIALADFRVEADILDIPAFLPVKQYDPPSKPSKDEAITSAKQVLIEHGARQNDTSITPTSAH